MGRACSMHGRNAKCLHYFGSEGKDYPEDLGIDVKIILEWILGKVWTGCAWLRVQTSGMLLWIW